MPLLINVKMLTVVRILIFIREKILCSAELRMKKSFINSGPVSSIYQWGARILYYIDSLILKKPITTAADDSLSFIYFSENTRFYISFELSTKTSFL